MQIFIFHEEVLINCYDNLTMEGEGDKFIQLYFYVG